MHLLRETAMAVQERGVARDGRQPGCVEYERAEQKRCVCIIADPSMLIQSSSQHEPVSTLDGWHCERPAMPVIQRQPKLAGVNDDEQHSIWSRHIPRAQRSEFRLGNVSHGRRMRQSILRPPAVTTPRVGDRARDRRGSTFIQAQHHARCPPVRPPVLSADLRPFEN